ncbi:hypothetical protein [Actinomyces minihominis]|uniref:hypothetical protein n=1 Tax=Actinomyces minihominis TaxID=2002838 RepID=UPI000C071F59|nr:hypothetical protein [Actinomyces minihominis]
MRSGDPSRSRPGEVGQPFGAITNPAPPPTERNPRLLKLLWWTMPVVVVLILAGSALVFLWVWSWSASRSAVEGDWSQTAANYQNQWEISRSFPQAWLTDYNLGSALVDEGEVEGGRDLLLGAFDRVPKATVQEDGSIGAFSYECTIRFNLSAATELLGDEAVAQLFDARATELYEEALRWVAPCQVSGGSGQGQEGDPQGSGDGGQEEQNQQVNPEIEQATGESADRLQEKLNQLNGNGTDGGEGDQTESESDGNSEGSGGSSGENPEETEAEKERREALEKKNQDQSERQREKEESYGRNPGTGGW